MKSTTFEIFAGWCAVLAGIFGFLYAVAFILIARSAPATGALLSGLFLLLVGLCASAALLAVYSRLRGQAPEFALWAYLLGFVGAVGSTIHGGYDLAVAINPSDLARSQAVLPSQVDPRGLLTFGVTGLSLFFLSLLIARSRRFPRGLAVFGYLSAVLTIILYLGRLIILDAANPVVVVPAILEGFLINPIWYVWLGITLWRGVNPHPEQTKV
jgi:hypothetical protein